jgi:energy-coupling factor transport system permease protein
MDFELARNIAIGQYIPGHSVIHRLDPRTKIIVTIVLAAAFSATRSLLANVFLVGLILLLVRMAEIPILFALRGLLPSLGVLLFAFTVQLFYQGWHEPAGQIYFEWGWVRITQYSVHLILLAGVRLTGYLFLLSLITLTTTASNLMHGFEWLVSPLRRIGVPVRELAVMYMIALRFVPTLAEELEQIMKAQASRCGPIGEQNFWRPDRTLRTRLPLIVPLFLNALRRAEELVVAMEARGFTSGARRTKYVQFHLTQLDLVAVLGGIVVYTMMRSMSWLLMQ